MQQWILGAGVVVALGAGIWAYQNGALTRFEHRSLACYTPSTGPFELVINKVKRGQDIQMLHPEGVRRLEISTVEKPSVTAQTTGLILEIDIETGRVRIQKRADVTLTTCDMSTFSM